MRSKPVSIVIPPPDIILSRLPGLLSVLLVMETLFMKSG